MIKKTTLDLLVITLGAALFAFAVAFLLDPNGIVPGGVTGIAMLLCGLFPRLPLGVTILILNVPLFVLSWRGLGHRFLLLSGFGTLVSSVFIDVFGKTLPPVQTEPLLAGVFGGLLMGAGLGIVFTKGATTGGSDIAARLLKVPFPHMQLGRLILLIDGAVSVAAGVVFGSVNYTLYAVITLYVSSRAMDGILYGLNIERLAFIISGKTAEIAGAITERLGRGATLLHGEGAYTGERRNIILCAVRRQQIAQLKALVKEFDASAFMILTEAREVLGEGFMDYENGL